MAEQWVIEINNEKVFFSRKWNGKTEESYAPVDVGRAAVFAAAIIQGYQPPRGLVRLDKLSD